MRTKSQAFDEISARVEQFRQEVDLLKAVRHLKEAQVEDKYIKPLFAALNWNTTNEGLGHAREEFVVQATQRVGDTYREPDYLLRLPDSKTNEMRSWLFIEAKHPKYDLTKETRWIRQAYQYAHSTTSGSAPQNRRVRLALLTDFEEFRLFDCVDPAPLRRGKERLLNKYVVPPFDWTFEDYVSDFNLLWETFERSKVMAGSLEHIKLTASDRKKNRILPDERFLNDLEAWRKEIASSMWRSNHRTSDTLLTAATQLLIDRLVFVKMLTDRGIEDDFLTQLLSRLRETKDKKVSLYKSCRAIFRRLDKTYNGSMFRLRAELDEVSVENDVLSSIIDELQPDNAVYSLAAMPVEIIGNAYERFLGQTIKHDGRGVGIKNKPEVRKSKGVYYTPHYIVEYIVEKTVGRLLTKCSSPEDVAKLRVVDPACGSGSFLLGAYEAFLAWHLAFFEKEAMRREKAGRKSLTPRKYCDLVRVVRRQGKRCSPTVRLSARLRKQILLNNIYGVDIDPQAAEVAQFSLCMKALERTTREELYREVDLFRTEVLPDLSKNIQCGNSLIAHDFWSVTGLDESEEIRRRVNPFDWEQGFPTVMGSGRFDAVIGNPPYIRMQRIAHDEADYLFSRYETPMSKTDISLLFIERGLSLASRKGFVGFICTTQWLAPAQK